MGPEWPNFAPPWIRPWTDLPGKKTTPVRDHEYFILTKFYQNQSSGSGEKNLKCEKLTPEDGRRMVGYDISSLEPSAQVS